ncbi:MAG: hypothetical protein IPJ16_05750 [Bacteroidales bacterium]|nr:hypothetical protein [Bacteroidales bacterium]
MKLEDFFSDFIENTLIDIEDSLEAFEEAVTNDILEYLKDCGEVLEPEICSVKMRNFKVNAFDYSDENESIDLFVTIAKKGNSIQKISDTDVISAFEKAKNTISLIRNGDFEGKIQDSNDSIDELIGIINDSKNIIKNARIFCFDQRDLFCGNIVPKDYEDDGYFWDYELWDIERIFQQYLIRSGKQKNWKLISKMNIDIS